MPHLVRVSDWPPLLWGARIDRRGLGRIYCGNAVEESGEGILAAAWSGPYAGSSPLAAMTSIGTGLLMTPDGIVAFCGNAGSDVVFIHRGAGELTVSNALPAAIALAGTALKQGYPYYNQDLITYRFGPQRYRRAIPCARGRIEPYYRAVHIGRNLAVSPLDHDYDREFKDFARYRETLIAELKLLFANAADRGRSVRYRPIVTLSRGYDSTAAAVLAVLAGCGEGFTHGQAVGAPPGTTDSGAHIGKMLGLKVTEFETLAYQGREDFPEAEFIASGYGGPQVYMAGTETALRGRLIVTGFGGDAIWHRDHGVHAPAKAPFYAGGYSGVNFNLRLPALSVAAPAIGAGAPGRIGALSRSAEMRPWSLGGDYDRPLPRRIAEQAGIPRDAFAAAKQMVTPSYDSAGRRAPPLEAYLSPCTLAEFERYLAEERPFSPWRARFRNGFAGLARRLVWSKKMHRFARKLGVAWPPLPSFFWHLRAGIRRNGFLFHWAVARVAGGYGEALAKTRRDGREEALDA